MMKITGLSHLLKWENLHNWLLTKYFFAPLYIFFHFFSKSSSFSFSPSLASLYLFEQCLRLGVIGTSSVCLPLLD